MKIYFVGSLKQKDEYGAYYQRIVEALEKAGHSVIHEHITGKTIRDVADQAAEERTTFYKRVMKWINSADMIVAEASFPSTLNVGHEITMALEKNKPTVVFYKKGYESLFLEGLKSDRLLLVAYDDHSLEDALSESVSFARDTADTRFNFFIAPKQVSYLDWIAKTDRIPRSVYLRRLIEKDIEDNEQYRKAEGL